MLPDHMNAASAHFNANWKKYQESLTNNFLYHREMYAALNEFLATRFNGQPISFLDLGCGDSSVIAGALNNIPINEYIGVDAAVDVLALAKNNMSGFACEKRFICDDMLHALLNLDSKVDVILTSYALHHLLQPQKVEFIQACLDKLKPNGYFLMIDVILVKQQTREEWLEALKARFKVAYVNITADELEFRMQHPRTNDFPEAIATFEAIAKKQGWANFQVLLQKEIFAFMLFSK